MPEQPLRHRRSAPPAGSVVTLRQLVGRLDVVEVPCNRCDRHGRLRLARLIAQHGPDMGVPELLRVLSADCPRRRAVARQSG